MKVGDKLWFLEGDNYRYDDNRMPIGVGVWVEAEIIKETSRYWIAKSRECGPIRVSKRYLLGGQDKSYGAKKWYTDQGKLDKDWLDQNRGVLSNKVRESSDISILMKIKELLR